MSEQELLALIGEIFVWLLSVAGAAFLLVQFGAQKWIENRFAKNLEAYKAQKLHEFDILLTRKIKWHEKEHEVLSMCWNKAILAQGALKRAISVLREYEDLNKLSAEEFENFLERSDLSEDNKEFISSYSNGRNQAYVKVLDHVDLVSAQQLFIDFNKYFEENRIFLRPHIKSKFEKLNEHIWSAWVSRKMSIRTPESKTDFWVKAHDTEKKEIAPLIKEIEDAIQQELFPHEYQINEDNDG